ncbi:hypothetical protein LCGC14_2595200 [marine sediment metagenome]|uniref:Phage replisome organiser N-terminal domain-containing protein n=1 Tax=marine sediment metagenome TaxID=412755 RepID=A0A0F9AAP9_9ZZZZ
MKWFRVYSEVLHDPGVRRLPSGLFKDWVLLLCIANEGKPRGVLPPVADIAYHLNRSPARVESLLTDLQGRGLIDEVDGSLVPHNWDKRQFESDDVAARVRKHRNGVTGNVTKPLHETPPETEAETEAETEVGA